MSRVGRLIRGTGIMAIAALVLSACGSPGFDQSTATRVMQAVDVDLDSSGAITEVAGNVVYLDELSGESDSSEDTYAVEDVVDDLPVRVSTQYTTDEGSGSNLDDLEGHTGRVEIAVTVENLTLESSDLTYDVAGESRETPALVGTPLSVAGSVELDGTRASDVQVDPDADSTTNGVVSQNSDGDAIIQWGTVLAPPQSEATTTFQLVADVEDFSAPGFDLAVQPGFHTDMSFEGMLSAAFDTSPNSEYGMQQNAIDLVADINDVLTRAGSTITEVRTNLEFTTETLGVEAAGHLRQSTEDVENEMQRLGDQLTALDSQVAGSLEGAETAMTSQLSQMVSSMSSLLGDTNATRQNLLQGEGCSATLRDAESNGSLYSSIVLLGSQLDSYAEANAECRDEIIAEIERTLGPETPTDEVCDEPSMTCALFAAEKSVLASMDQLVKDGQQIVNGLQPFEVTKIREENDAVGTVLGDLSEQLGQLDDDLGNWDDEQESSLDETIEKLETAHAEIESVHEELATLHQNIKDAYEQREAMHEDRMEDLEAEHSENVAELEAAHQVEIDELKDGYENDLDDAKDRIEALEEVKPEAKDAQRSMGRDIRAILRNQADLADQLCELRVEEPEPEPENPSDPGDESEPTPSASPSDDPTDPEESSARPTDEVSPPVDTSINEDIDELRAQLVDTNCDDEPYDTRGDSLTAQVQALREQQDSAWENIIAIVDADQEASNEDSSEDEADEDEESENDEATDDSEDSEESEELPELPLEDLRDELEILDGKIGELRELAQLEDLQEAGSGGAKEYVQEIVEDLTALHGDASQHQIDLAGALDQFETDQEEHVDNLGDDINEAFKDAADKTREEFPAVVEGQVRTVTEQVDSSRESILESYNTTIAGLRTTSDAMVTETGEQIEEQRSTMESQHEAVADALTGNTQDVIELIHESTSASTRDMQSASAQLGASLNNVILDLGDPNIQGSGILGSMTASSAMSDTADYQLALASQRASGYANVRSEDISEIMLRQAQFSASLEAAATLPAFHLEVPSGASSQTMYSFRIGGDNS